MPVQLHDIFMLVVIILSFQFIIETKNLGGCLVISLCCFWT